MTRQLKLAVLSGLFLLSSLAMVRSVRAQSGPPTGMMQMPVVVPLFIEDSLFTSRLVMVNSSLVSTYADVVLRGLDGKEIAHQRVMFAPQSQQRVEIGALLRTTGSRATTGSITIMQSPDLQGMVILAQLAMTYVGSGEPNYIDEETAMPTAESSLVLRSVADSSYGSPVVAITSLGESGQNVTVECLAGSETHSKIIQLYAGETLVTEACASQTVHGTDLATILGDEREEPRQSQPVGIALTSDGKPGSFAAFALARHGKEDDRYFSSINFSDPKMVMSANTVFVGVPVGSAKLLPEGNYIPYFSLANFSAKAAHVTIKYAQTAGSTSSARQVADLMIPARSSKELAFDILEGDPDLKDSFIVVADGSSPGDLMVKLVSRSESKLREVELLGKDEKGISNGGNHPWSIEQGTESTLLLFNHDKNEQKFTVTISGGGVVWQKDYMLASMRTEAISIGNLIENGIKDGYGKTLPKIAISGEIGWSNPEVGKGTGRLLQSNRDLAMARSFSCVQIAVLCRLLVSTGTTTFPVGTTVYFMRAQAVFCVLRTYQGIDYCGSNMAGSATFFWSTSNSAIAAISSISTVSNVSTLNLYGAGVGSAIITVDAEPNLCAPTGQATATVQVPTAQFSVTLSGTKTSGDSLSFLRAPYDCSENLGSRNCSSIWLRNFEAMATVSDDASHWSVSQQLTGRVKGNYVDSNGVLQPFDDPINNPADNPSSTFLQAPSGQKVLFYIDTPGTFKTRIVNNVGRPVDSVTLVYNFNGSVCSNNYSGDCSNVVSWYVKIVVNTGGILDTTNSVAGLGSLSLNF
jgi:hypothetical protein